MSWTQDKFNEPVFTHPSEPGWELTPYDGRLLVRTPTHFWDVDIGDDGAISVYGEDVGCYEPEPARVTIPFVILAAIVDWLREHNRL
jgi:hypothetical protein